MKVLYTHFKGNKINVRQNTLNLKKLIKELNEKVKHIKKLGEEKIRLEEYEALINTLQGWLNIYLKYIKDREDEAYFK